jgi:glutamyl-tRNA synthetase
MAISSEKASKPRVRFAPSPTGYLHVGGGRTALFNWLFARHHGGTFVLRIEDTDLERSTPEMVRGILDGMAWMGLDWDEGPYHQTERMDLYRETSAKLVRSGHAYYCFCTKEHLEARRASAQAEGRQPKYEGTCRKIGSEEAERRRAAGEAAAVRFAVAEGGSTGFEDAVFGRVEFANEQIEDFVLLRSDQVPTYHLSVVADDIDMRITHIIRGADHISNTPKQVLLYQALGAPLPVFAHVPLILGIPQFPRSGGLDAAGNQPREDDGRADDRAVLAARHLEVECGVRPRQAGVVQRRVHSSNVPGRTCRAPASGGARRRTRDNAGTHAADRAAHPRAHHVVARRADGG